MYQHASSPDVVNVEAVDFEVEHRGHALGVDQASDSCGSCGRPKGFVGLERVRTNEILPVFAPERMVARAENRFGLTCDA